MITTLSMLLLATFQEIGHDLNSQKKSEVVIDQTLAIINDQVLTSSDLSRELALTLKERGISLGDLTASDQMAFSRFALQSRLIDMLFQEGFRMSGMDPEVLEQSARQEIKKRQEDAGSMAAYTQHLAELGTNIENETKRINFR